MLVGCPVERRGDVMVVDGGALLAYTLVVLGLFLIPGPAVLLTLARSMLCWALYLWR